MKPCDVNVTNVSEEENSSIHKVESIGSSTMFLNTCRNARLLFRRNAVWVFTSLFWSCSWIVLKCYIHVGYIYVRLDVMNTVDVNLHMLARLSVREKLNMWIRTHKSVREFYRPRSRATSYTTNQSLKPSSVWHVRFEFNASNSKADNKNTKYDKKRLCCLQNNHFRENYLINKCPTFCRTTRFVNVFIRAQINQVIAIQFL